MVARGLVEGEGEAGAALKGQQEELTVPLKLQERQCPGWDATVKPCNVTIRGNWVRGTRKLCITSYNCM